MYWFLRLIQNNSNLTQKSYSHFS